MKVQRKKKFSNQSLPTALAPLLSNFRELYLDNSFVCSLFSYVSINHSFAFYIMIAYNMLSCFILMVRF